MIGLRVFLSEDLPLIHLHPDFQLYVGQGYIVISSRNEITTKDELSVFFMKLTQEYGNLFRNGCYKDHIVSQGAIRVVSVDEPEVAGNREIALLEESADAWNAIANREDCDNTCELDELLREIDHYRNDNNVNWWAFKENTAQVYNDPTSSPSTASDTDSSSYTDSDSSCNCSGDCSCSEYTYGTDSEEEPCPPSSPVCAKPYVLTDDSDSLRRIWCLSRKLGAN